MDTIGDEGNGRNLPLFNAIKSTGTSAGSFTAPKEDYSHTSSYWSDKKYGHVAPNGTVHPQRYADRKKEQAAYESSREGKK